MYNNGLFNAENCLEEVEVNGKRICVVDYSKDKYDNVYCFDEDNTLIWRIKQPPVQIGGTARCTYVGVRYTEGCCKAIDYYGRSFVVDITNGEITSMNIVK